MKLKNLLLLTLTALTAQNIGAMNRDAIAARLAQEAASLAVQADTKKEADLKKDKFIKTALLFNDLPEELQQRIYSWDKQFICLKELSRHKKFISYLETYQDHGWKAIAGSADGYVYVWDLTTAKCLHVIRAFGSASIISAIKWYDDNGPKALVSSWSGARHLVVIDLNSGKIEKKIACYDDIQDIHIYHDKKIWKAIVRSTKPNALYILDLAKDQIVRTLLSNALAIYQDGEQINSISADQNHYCLHVQNLATGQQLQTLTGHTSAIISISTYQDATGWKAISASYDNTLRVWDLSTGTCLHILEGHTNPIEKVAVWQDATGWKGISGSWMNILRVWDLSSGKQICTLTGPETAGGCSDIKIHKTETGWKAICAWGDSSMQIWDLATQQCLQTLSDHTESSRHFALYGDGENLNIIATSNHKLLKAWSFLSQFETIRQEELDFRQAKDIIKMMNDRDDSTLQRIIYEYAI